MRPIGLGLAAALLVAVLAPVAVMSAPKAAPAVSDASRKQGMADAPALVQAAGLPCQVSDARLIGKAPPDKKTGAAGTSLYEVACTGAMGYLLQTMGPGQVNAFSCLEANYPADPATKAPNPCLLPANSDPKAQLAPLLAKAKISCVPEKVRGIGQTKTNTLIEIACPGGLGYIMTATAPLDLAKDATATNCLAYDTANGNLKCLLNDPSVRLAIVDSYAAQAKNGCVVKDRRFVGMFTDGTEGYEAACQDGKGYVYKVNSAGTVVSTLDCAKVPSGTCDLTDSRAATTEQAGLYSKLAKNAGSSCVVSKYAVFPARGTDDVVEMVCGDGNSAIGIFPAAGKGQVLDCGRSLVAGYKCSMGKVDYSPLTEDLRKFDQKSCVVSNARPAAKTPKGTIMLEVACADGLKGYMIEYNIAPQVVAIAATSCAFTGGCTLPGNK